MKTKSMLMYLEYYHSYRLDVDNIKMKLRGRGRHGGRWRKLVQN